MATAKVTIPGRTFVSYPLVSFVYKLFVFATVAARLPLWILASSFQRWRQNPRWTFKQALMVRFFTPMLAMSCRAETPQPLSLKPGKEKDQFALVQPFSPDVYCGPLESSKVVPEVIGGTWYPVKPADAKAVGPVIMHIHGGAFVLGDGRIDATGAPAKLFQEHGKLDTTFFPQYRLASRPTSAPFPAALQDSLTSYLYLVRTLGVSPQNIVLSGDSAGANLVIGLLRYIVQYGEKLNIPQPKSAVVVSPWLAPVKHLLPDITITSNPNYNTDYLGIELCRWGAKAYAQDVSPESPWISPLDHPFATPVPIFCTVGTAEWLEMDATQWIREMGRIEGNSVEAFYEPDAVHDTLLGGHMLGFEKSSEEVARRIGVFVRQHM
ncbi:alpha/beta hydrolase fold-3 domain-containing protein [Xylariaceae sp. FL1019]|nr:alpha/beta hydrolase fold-3 domain-containing protein [Xylariaceae sp. FL1019]